MEISGESFIGVIAQLPFESQSAGDIYNSFCTIQPVAFQDGRRTSPDQFPNNGLIWWMLRSNANRFANPGQLVSFVVEDAIDPKTDDPSGNMFQADRASVERCALDDVVEILTVPPVSIQRANDLVSRANLLTVDHPPCGMVLVRWQNNLYGPLRTIQSEADRPGEYRIGFASPSAGQPVFRLPCSELDSLVSATDRALHVEVALDSQLRERSHQVSRCEYELLPIAVYEDLKTIAKDRILLESDSEVLRRASKGILTRKRRRLLTDLLVEFEEGLTEANAADLAEDTKDVIEKVGRAIAADLGQAEEVAEALMESGLLDERIQAGIEGRVEKYIESRATTITADIEEHVSNERAELENLSRQRTRQKEDLQSQARRAQESLERDLAEATKEQRAGLDRERADLDKQAEGLEREREVLEKRLERVTDRLTNARDDVINDFLTLAPLLNQTRLLSSPTEHLHSSVEARKSSISTPAQLGPFTLHPHLSAEADPPTASDLSEVQFFERFVKHTRDSGFVYRRIDLASFHISAKTCDLTVLGGVSGTGKSSLPRLYAEALAGADSAGTDRYQLVGVNPSWLDVGDLLGRVNALDARFQPSESGLFSLLIHAHEEYRRWESDSGVYLVCLDEMNLAYVEHYFSVFLQVLESPPAHRRLQCFAKEVVSPDSTFARWASLDLPPSLRFVGTVNFDETTKPLSLRVLDRVNLIKLRPGRLGDLDLSTTASIGSTADGATVTSAMFESWKKSAQPARNVAELLDSLRGPLADLGCPLSPRRYRSLCQFLASSPAELLTPIQALDLQISQRLLPQIRGLFRREAQDAFETVVSLLEKHDATFSESLQALEELRGGDYSLAPELA